MTPANLHCHLDSYLSLREALGFQMRVERTLLRDFVQFIETAHVSGPIRAQLAVDWACASSSKRGAGGAPQRLTMARGFLTYLRATLPETEVPERDLIASARRSKPFLLRPGQLHALMQAAQQARPRGALPPYTLSTLIGLLASTGIRAGEALRLTMADVTLDREPPVLHIRETKFHKSRLVPLHASTADQLRHYQAMRRHCRYDTVSEGFFLSEKGTALTYATLARWFTTRCGQLGIAPINDARRPTLHALRHTFAVERMRRWYEAGADVRALLPTLSVYLGHVRPQDTYWYLSGHPRTSDRCCCQVPALCSQRRGVMSASHSPLAPHIQAFFTDHLCRHKRASPQTLASCRDSFRLLLTFVKETTSIEPSALRVADLDAPPLLAFLDHLEQQRGHSIRSRNIRLSALRTFFRFVALRDPESVEMVTRVLAIPSKREDKKLVGYLTRPEIDALIAAPDQSSWIGRRDHALLLTMYNSGARVSEITSLQRAQVAFGATTFLELHGKGRKARTIPLWPQTRNVLKRWFREVGKHKSEMAFPNAQGRPLARHSVNYLIHKAVEGAAPRCPSLLTRPITPHLIRHTTATHLLQAGIDIATIALWLGHESIETTHVYLETDLATKERALQKLAPVDEQEARFTADDPLLAFLTSL